MLAFLPWQCRICTLLVCDACSSKKLTLAAADKSDKSGRVRICDGCFNNACRAREEYEGGSDGGGSDGGAAAGGGPATFGSGGSTSAAALQKDSGALSRAKFALFSGRARAKEPPGAPLNAAAGAAEGVAGAASAARRAGEALAQRGAKLESLAERMGALNDQAALFQAEARKLREQQANKKWWEL